MERLPNKAEMEVAVHHSVLTEQVIRTSRERVIASREALKQSDVLCGSALNPESASTDGSSTSEQLNIVESSRLDKKTIVVVFSDGTTTTFAVEELSTLKPERMKTVEQQGRSD